MSVAQQAKASRRKAKNDPRYKKLREGLALNKNAKAKGGKK